MKKSLDLGLGLSGGSLEEERENFLNAVSPLRHIMEERDRLLSAMRGVKISSEMTKLKNMLSELRVSRYESEIRRLMKSE